MSTMIAILCVLGLVVVGLAFGLVMDVVLCRICRFFGWRIAE